MTEYEQLIREVNEGSASRAQDASNGCRGFLASLPFNEASRLESVIRENSASYLSIFEHEMSLCKNTIELGFELKQAAAACPNSDDSFILGNAASLLFQLLIAAERRKATGDLLGAIERAYEDLQRTFLNTVIDQIDGLCSFLIEVSRTLRRLKLADARIYLLDFPIGNTIPVILLQNLLKTIRNVEVLRVSLARNEVKKVGLTRRQLLQERIAQAKICENDVVVYIDEWETGSNFKAICEHLRKELPPSAFFLPLALLSARAESNARYKSFCERHDKIVQEIGAVLSSVTVFYSRRCVRDCQCRRISSGRKQTGWPACTRCSYTAPSSALSTRL